jgi:polysaccharide export outer membrane protein
MKPAAWIGSAMLLALAAGCATRGPRAVPLARYRPDESRIIPTANPPPAAASAAASGAARDERSRVLEAGDRVEIQLRAIPQPETLKAVVDDNGTLTFPFIGQIGVAGKTCAEAAKLVEQTYIDREIYKYITVIVVPPESEFAVQGEVYRPGSFTLTRDMTLTQALARGGRYTEYADRSRVRIIRGKDTIEVDVRRIEAGKDPDFVIKAGDVIVVPRHWL